MPRCEPASRSGSYGKSSHGILLRDKAGFNPPSTDHGDTRRRER
jgi:hypothetical protein